jgi:hypothetical protein
MNPLNLSHLTSAVEAVVLAAEAAVLAAGTACNYYPPGPDDYGGLRALVVPSTATPVTARMNAVKVATGMPLPLTDLVKEHLSYLREVSSPENPLIKRATAWVAARAWLDCWEATGYALPVPVACTGPDGQMLYTWDRKEHHLELEITPSETPSFFYRNRQTGELWMEDYASEAVSPEVLEKLKLFV